MSARMLAGHYHFAPDRVHPAARMRRGRSSAKIQYLRHAFFTARTFVDVDDLNAQFRRWRDEIAQQRPHPEPRDRTVAQVLAEEQPRLLPLAAHPFDTDVMCTRSRAPDPIPATLSDHLRQLGLVHTASELNDFIARATQRRWSPVVQRERLVQAELEARLRHRVERRLKDARLGRFKPMVDWEWDWPKAIHRSTVDRVFTLDFLGENVIVVALHGLGTTMIAKNLVHQSILAGHSARFPHHRRSDPGSHPARTARALQRRLRSYLRPSLGDMISTGNDRKRRVQSRPKG